MIMDTYKMHFKEIDIKNRVYNYYFDYLNKAEKIETKYILIDKKNYEDFFICFTRCDRRKPIRMLSLHYRKLMGKIEENKSTKYLIVEDYI